MKKQILTTLLIASIALSASACGSGKSNSKPNAEAPSNTETSGSEVVSETETIAVVVPSEASISEQRLFDQDGIVITATGLKSDGVFGPEISVLIENNSDKNITVQTRNGSVNGYMMDLQISSDVASGKKTNDSIILMENVLERCNIDMISDIEFSLHIFDSESWETIVDTEMIRIDTSAAGTFDQVYDNSGNVVYENNGIRIISKDFLEDGVFGPEQYLYIENNSGQNIIVQTRNTSIDGYMVDTVISSEILSGKVRIDAMTFMKTDIETNGITNIETIETSFAILNADNFETIEETAPISISVNQQ